MNFTTTHFTVSLRIIVLIFLAILFCNPTHGQFLRNIVRSADRAYQDGHYLASEVYYGLLFDKLQKDSKGKLQRKLMRKWELDPAMILSRKAYALWELNEFHKAELAFGNLITLSDSLRLSSRYDTAAFYLADAIHHQFKRPFISEAVPVYKTYLNRSPDTSWSEYFDTLATNATVHSDWIHTRRAQIQDPANTQVDSFYQLVVNSYGDDSNTSKLNRDTFFRKTWKIYSDDCQEIYHLNDSINSGYGEFAPVEWKGNLLFTTYDGLIRSNSRYPDRSRYNQRYAILDHSLDSLQELRVVQPAQSLESFNDDRSIHVGMASPSPTGDTLYYNQCTYVGSTFKIRCNLYRRIWKDGFWSEPVALTDLNLKGTTSEMPSLGRYNGREALYFVSDRSGGAGRKDIWYAYTKMDGSFEEPQNLTAINTIGDDVTPFYHRALNRLFFSSDGYRTIGGLDVFWTAQKDTIWQDPSNLDIPINGTYDDRFFFLTQDKQTAYFSSDRLGSVLLGNATAPCCPDIWAVEYDLDIDMEIKVYDEETKRPLTGAQLLVFERLNPFDSIELINETLADSAKTLTVTAGKEYVFYAFKDGYKSRMGVRDLTDYFPSSSDCIDSIEEKLYLPPERFRLRVAIVDARFPDVAVPAARLDYTISNPDGTVALDSSQIELPPDQSYYYFPIESFNKNILLTGTDPTNFYTQDNRSYFTAQDSFQFTVPDDKYMLEARALVPLCPDTTALPLYFGHDSPGPRTSAISTAEKTYDEVFLDYERDNSREYQRLTNAISINEDGFIDVKDRVLIANYNSVDDDVKESFKEVAKYLVNVNMANSFFDDEIRASFNRVTERMDVIYQYLERGEKVKFLLSGFTSPTGKSSYNDTLSKRRINSVERYIEKLLREKAGSEERFQELADNLVWVRKGEGEKRRGNDFKRYLKDNVSPIDPELDTAKARIALDTISQGRSVLGRAGVLPAIGRRIELRIYVLDPEGNPILCETPPQLITEQGQGTNQVPNQGEEREEEKPQDPPLPDNLPLPEQDQEEDQRDFIEEEDLSFVTTDLPKEDFKPKQYLIVIDSFITTNQPSSPDTDRIHLPAILREEEQEQPN